jgi:hypothetical protein
MGKITKAAERIAAAVAESRNEPNKARNEALGQELDAFLAPIRGDSTPAHQAQQADLWIGAIRFRLNQIGVPLTLKESDAFFVSMFGDMAAGIVAEHEISAREYARELEAAGLSCDEVLDAASRIIEDEARGAKSAVWN